MRAAGRPGRGERAKVAQRVRDLLGGGEDPAARTEPSRPEEATRGWVPGSDVGPDVPRQGVSSWRGRLRWDPGRRGAAALGVAVVAVVAATGWWLAASRPREVPISASGATSSATVVAPGTGPASALTTPSGLSTGSAHVTTSPMTSVQPVVVDVAGKVRHPGIYTFAAGARVYDALRAAGGARRGVSTLALNLAAPLHDGQQIVVGAPGSPAAPGVGADGTGAGSSSTLGPAAVVDVNTATLEQLEALPGVGPVLGQHILDWRAAHGQFASIDQLQEVSGIGPAKFAAMRGLVSV